MNRSHTDDQEAWQMFQKRLNDMRSKANNDFERLGYRNMFNQFKMYENNVLTLAKLNFLKIHFPNLEVFDE
jgi:predicted component of type VI protein secretion system